MIFEVALALLKNGSKVRRAEWTPGVHVFICSGSVWMNNGAPWIFSNDGILADDWELVLDHPADEHLATRLIARAAS